MQSQGLSSRKSSFGYYLTTETPRLSSLALLRHQRSASAPGLARIEQAGVSLGSARAGSAAELLARVPKQAERPPSQTAGTAAWQWSRRRFEYLQQPSTHSVQPRKQSEPPPHIFSPAWPGHRAGPVQLPALKCCFSAGEAEKYVHLGGRGEWRHKSRALLCSFWQGIPLPCSPDSLRPLRISSLGRGSPGGCDTDRLGSWLRHEHVTGKDAVTKKPFCSGVPARCTLGIVWATSHLPAAPSEKKT